MIIGGIAIVETSLDAAMTRRWKTSATVDVLQAQSRGFFIPSEQRHATDLGAPSESTSPTGTVPTREVAEVIDLPLPTPTSSTTRENFVVLQDWEGVVDGIDETSFWSRLVDRTAAARHEGESAQIALEDVDPDDRELVRVGAIFYLTIGRHISASGRQEKVTRIVFRRLPAWTRSTLARAQQRADELAQFLEGHAS